MRKTRQTVCLIPRNRVYRNQFDNKILFVLRGEHVQGASKCIVGFPASDEVERRMGPTEVTTPQASVICVHLRSSSFPMVSFLRMKIRNVFRRTKFWFFLEVSEYEE